MAAIATKPSVHCPISVTGPRCSRCPRAVQQLSDAASSSHHTSGNSSPMSTYSSDSTLRTTFPGIAAKPGITGVGSWVAMGTGGGSHALTGGPRRGGWVDCCHPVVGCWASANSLFDAAVSHGCPCSTGPRWLFSENVGSNVVVGRVVQSRPPIADTVS